MDVKSRDQRAGVSKSTAGATVATHEQKGQDSKTAILAAIAGNLLVAAMKFTAAVWCEAKPEAA
jgi:hypothetical protein